MTDAHRDHDDISGLSFEAARSALEEVVRQLESGAATLEDSLALWEKGESLAQVCQTWLAGARSRLDAVRPSATADETPRD